MTCPTCVTLTRERDNARDLAAALEEELAQSDVRASRAPEAEDVRVVEESSVPWEELFGYMPEITDGLPVADYLEGIRGEGGARQALADQWRYKGEFGWGPWQEGYGPNPEGSLLDDLAGGDS